MSIKINQDKCVGCGKCTEVCPGDLIKLSSENKAFNRSTKECWGCSSCVKECKFNAIAFFLGADMGGQGSSLSVKDRGDLVDWNIEDSKGNVQTITVNKKDANKY